MTVQPLTLQEAQRKARFGHRDWVYYTGSDGIGMAAPASRTTIKAAMLGVGVTGRFLLLGASNGVGSLQWWSDGCRLMRNAKHLWGRPC